MNDLVCKVGDWSIALAYVDAHRSPDMVCHGCCCEPHYPQNWENWLETCHVGFEKLWIDVFVVWIHWGLMGFLIAGSNTYPNAAQTFSSLDIDGVTIVDVDVPHQPTVS